MTYVNNVTGTLYADVSYANPPADDSYTGAGYRVLRIRSNDGTVVDTNFAANCAWCVNAVNSGAMDFFLDHIFWRSNWQTTINNHISLVNDASGRIRRWRRWSTWRPTEATTPPTMCRLT